MSSSVSSPSENAEEIESDVEMKDDDDNNKETKKIDRHCAFCLTSVPGEKVNLCSKCKRRAYCSKECQAADWKLSKPNKPAWTGKIHGYGQGHKNWCGLVEYGEEDIDWKVVPVAGKGLGIEALRDIPPLYRIMVEGLQTNPILPDGIHPEMDQLVCTHSVTTKTAGFEIPTLDKFEENGVETPNGKKLGLRLARVNHTCDPNAFVEYEKDYNVLILCSNQEIKKGMEICQDYLSWSGDVLRRKTKTGVKIRTGIELRKGLFGTWGISCPTSCVCRDEDREEMLKSIKQLYDECEAEYKSKNVIIKSDKAISLAEKVGCCVTSTTFLHGCASDFAKSALEFDKAKYHFQLYLNFARSVFHPKSQVVGELEQEFREL